MTLDRIRRKVDHFRISVELLEQIPQATLEEFSSDPRNVDAAIYRLQTAIQAIIDIGSFVAARLGLAMPEKSRDILDHLETGGHLPQGSVKRYEAMFAFRNRVVHLYETIDARIVYDILRHRRGDLEILMRHLLVLLDS